MTTPQALKDQEAIAALEATNAALDTNLGLANACLESTRKERAAMEAQNKLYREAMKAVSDLIDNSNGVCGLHLNGDDAPWSELRTNGRFEAWLLKFDQALALSPVPAAGDKVQEVVEIAIICGPTAGCGTAFFIKSGVPKKCPNCGKESPVIHFDALAASRGGK